MRERNLDLLTSVNLSGAPIGDGAFTALVIALVEDTGAKLCLEITETVPEASVTAYPALNSAALGAADAHDERVGVLRAFERAIYGRVPHLALALGDKSPLACGAIATAPLCERWQAAVSPNGTAFDIIVLAPPAPRAMLICQVFQRAPQSMARIAEALAGGARWRLGETWLQLLLGRYIHAPPLEWVVRQGFGLAFFCPGDVVPDRVPRTHSNASRRMRRPMSALAPLPVGLA